MNSNDIAKFTYLHYFHTPDVEFWGLPRSPSLMVGSLKTEARDDKIRKTALSRWCNVRPKIRELRILASSRLP